MNAVVEGAEAAVDWRSYLRERPWVSLGTAFAIGYLLVPRRVQAPRVEVAPVMAAAIQPEAPKSRPSFLWQALKTVGGLAIPVAARAAQGYAVRWVEGFLRITPPDPSSGT